MFFGLLSGASRVKQLLPFQHLALHSGRDACYSLGSNPFLLFFGDLSTEIFFAPDWHSVGVILIHIPHTYALNRVRLFNGLCESGRGLSFSLGRI